MTERSHSPNPIRVVIQQPALPKYRVPVFAELARRPRLEIQLMYAQGEELPNVAAEGFRAQSVPMSQRMIGGRPLLWHQPQWDHATKTSCDVLVLSWNLHYASLIPALLRARANGVATILWGHGYSKTESAWRSWPRRKVTELATALLFYNHTAARQFVEMGWDPKRIFVALNALDQTPIQAARRHWLDRPEELARFRRENRLDSGPVILFVSRFDPANRLDLLLHAAEQLRARYPRLKLVLIGKGPDEAPLRALSISLGLADRAHFMGAIYDEMKLAPFFLSADLFCYPANIGLSILHAFGYGLPVVTSDRIESQNPEIEALRDGGNGLLYADGDIDALAAALQRVLDDSALRQNISAGAIQTVTEQFTLENMVDGFEAAVRCSLALQCK
ncbi:MAG: glycosyltransferase family 4 protein [Phycisphaerales bacterium]|nr:glycosyltransferase family 4 protein [Phycisphaerales bacterium]